MPAEVRGRALVVRKLEMLPVECVVRGYITGSGWKDYQPAARSPGSSCPPACASQSSCPSRSSRPRTKADVGHDEAIDFERAAELVGDRALMERVRDVSIELYAFAAAHARERGVILADTKFEFGLDAAGELVVGDEVLTPDSSRYWPADGYEPGRGQPSFDKQYVRDWASSSGWDKLPPAPAIPDDVVAGTRARYIEAYERIVGEPFQAWLERTGAASMRARVLIRPKAGSSTRRAPLSSGRCRRSASPASSSARRPADRARRRGPGAAGRDVRAAARQPADRGLRGPAPRQAPR